MTIREELEAEWAQEDREGEADARLEEMIDYLLDTHPEYADMDEEELADIAREALID